MKMDMQEKEQNKKKSLLFVALKRHKIGLLIVLLCITLSSTLAWFIYNTTVNVALTGRVKAWNISFSTDDTGGTAVFRLTDLYPGMPSITRDDSTPCNMENNCVLISNDGDIAADVSLVVKYFYLFGEKQVLNEDYELTVLDDGTYKISGDKYPFNLMFKIGSETLEVDHSTELYFTLDWPYEKTESDYRTECPTVTTHTYCTNYDTYLRYYDAIDTEVGEKSYLFNHSTVEIEMPTGVDADSEEGRALAEFGNYALGIMLTIDFVQAH